MRSRIAFALALSLAATSPLLAQNRSTFSVGVADAETGSPISGAEIVLPDLKLLVRSDANGQARVPNVPLGTHRVRVRFLGYTASDVQLKFDRDTIGAVFRLGRSASTISGVDISATQTPSQLKDFEIRKKQGIGRFLTEQDLAPLADREFMHVAATTFPGVSIRNDDEIQPHLVGTRSNCAADANPNRGIDRIGGEPGAKEKMGARKGFQDGPIKGSCVGGRSCLIQIWLDNLYVGETDPLMMRTWDLSGVEYYSGNTVPARYRTATSACGVLLLWSKWS